MSEPLGVCIGCGGELRRSAAFCARCGLRIGELAPQRDESSTRAEAREDGWSVVRPALGLFGAMLSVSFVGMIAYKIGSSPWIGVAQDAANALLVGAFAWRERATLRAPLARFGRALPAVKTALVLAGAALSVTGYFALLTAIGVRFVRYTDEMRDAGWPVWTAYVSIALYPAVFEELAFRGVILRRLARAMGSTEAWLVQAGMFSVLHLMPMVFPSHFVLGLMFGWLRLQSGSLYPSVVAHALWNACVIWDELARSG